MPFRLFRSGWRPVQRSVSYCMMTLAVPIFKAGCVVIVHLAVSVAFHRVQLHDTNRPAHGLSLACCLTFRDQHEHFPPLGRTTYHASLYKWMQLHPHCSPNAAEPPSPEHGKWSHHNQPWINTPCHKLHSKAPPARLRQSGRNYPTKNQRLRYREPLHGPRTMASQVCMAQR